MPDPPTAALPRDRRRRPTRRLAATLAVLLVGLALSVAAVLQGTADHGQDADGTEVGATEGGPATPRAPRTGDPSDPPAPGPSEPEEPAHEPGRDPATLLVSASGGLPDGLEARLAEEPAITATTVVRGDTLGLVATARADGDAVDELPEGWRFPVEVLAVDPASYAEVLAVPEVATLGPGEALLSASSAAVRRLEPAAVLRFEDGTELVVAGVLPDAQLGAGEVVVSTASTIAPTEPRYLLATQRDPSVPFDLAATARDLDLDADVLVTAHGGEVPVLRHAPDVMAPARLKRAFGEFAVTDGPGRWFQQGATWLRAAYAEREVPIIGKLECHEAMFEPLTAALQELVDRGLDDLVDPADSTGCWAPRVQRGTTPSSHAWGVALDVNVQGNHQGAEPTMPPEVVEAFTRHGFVWGGTWPVPDGMHFELVVDRPPGEAWMPQPDDAG